MKIIHEMHSIRIILIDVVLYLTNDLIFDVFMRANKSIHEKIFVFCRWNRAIIAMHIVLYIYNKNLLFIIYIEINNNEKTKTNVIINANDKYVFLSKNLENCKLNINEYLIDILMQSTFENDFYRSMIYIRFDYRILRFNNWKKINV